MDCDHNDYCNFCIYVFSGRSHAPQPSCACTKPFLGLDDPGVPKHVLTDLGHEYDATDDLSGLQVVQ